MPDQPVARVGPLAAALTEVIRVRTRDALEAAFSAWLIDEDRVSPGGGYEDPRETMMDLAPLVDCARRLGLDPIAVYEPLMVGASGRLKDVITVFLRRKDVTLGAFGWSLVELEDGPAYRFGWPRSAPRAAGDEGAESSQGA
jgi:hypothetical protein